MAPCDIRVTFEHSHQISRIKTSASSSETCQRDALKSSFSAVYCPDSSFCGQDIDPQKTGQLKFLSKKHCAVFHLNLSLCAKLQANLDNAGKFIFSPGHQETRCTEYLPILFLVPESSLFSTKTKNWNFYLSDYSPSPSSSPGLRLLFLPRASRLGFLAKILDDLG